MSIDFELCMFFLCAIVVKKPLLQHYTAIAQSNLDKLLLFCETLFNTKCCQIAAIVAL